MPSIDDRIVRIEFDNAEFEREIANTLSSLADLNKGLQLSGADDGAAALAGIGSAVDTIASRFSALGAVAFSVIQSITQGALGLIKQLGTDILDPIFTGGLNRAKNIEQAKFLFEGLGINIEAAMASALAAVKGTAFGLDEAAKAAAQFGASGIAVGEDMTSALRGVAGAAALTGRSFTEIADIFAGSAGTGKVTNQDLMQFATRGLNAAAALAKQWGITEQQVREMAANGEIDFAKFAAAMDQAFGEHATTANKTFTGALANMRAALARLGATFITPQLTQLRDIFNAVSPVVDNLTASLQPLMLMFTMITGEIGKGVIRSLNGISFEGLKAAMPAIVRGLDKLFGIFLKIKLIAQAAFQDIFPSGFSGIIVKIADGFEKFANALDFGSEGGQKLLSIFKGVFSVLSIGWTVVKEGAKFLLDLGKALIGAVGGDAVAGIAKLGDFFTWLQEVLVKGGGIKQFFDGLREAVSVLVGWIVTLRDKIASMFGGFDKKAADAVEDVTGRIGDRFATLRSLVDKIKGLWGPFAEFASKVAEALGQAWEAISGFFDGLGERIASILSSGAFNGALDALNTGLLAVLTAAIVKWIKNGFNIGVGVNVGLAGDLIEKIKGTFDELTNTLKALQTQIKAKAIKDIAISVGILTASVLVLSLIDSAALTKALTAMAVGFAQLMASFAILTKLTLDPRSAASFGILSAGFILLGVAMLILAGAAKVLASMNWDELARGLLGVLAGILLLTLATKLLIGQSGGMIAAGAGMVAMSVGLLAMSLAVRSFAGMSLGDLAKGLIGVAAALGIIALAMNFMPPGPSMALMGAGLVGVGIGLVAMGLAMKLFASMNWAEIGRGLVALGGGLGLIALAVNLMPGGMIPTGLGLIAIAIGLGFFAKALQAFGSMSWEEIARGLTALAGSLLILAIGVTAMSGALVGAIALGVIAASLIVLSGALKVLSGTSWDEIGTGLLKLAAAIGGVALVALLLGPAIPFILGLGVALAVVGVAFALFGAGAILVAKAFEIIGKSGAAGAAGLKLALESIGESLSALGRGLAKGIIDTIQVFADGIGELIPAFAKIINGLLTAAEKNLPKLVSIIEKVLTATIKLIYEYGPQFSDAGVFMLLTMLTSIRDNIYQLTDVVVDIITGFLTEFANRQGDIVNAGINVLLAFIQGIADNISLVIGVVTQIITTLITEIGNNALLIVQAGVDTLVKFLEGISSNIQLIIDTATNLVVNFITGLTNSAQKILDAGLWLVLTLIWGIARNLIVITNTAATLLVAFLQELTNHVPEVAKAATDLVIQVITEIGKNGLRIIVAGIDAIKAFLKGLSTKIPEIAEAALDFIINVLEGIRHAIDDRADELGDAGRHLVGAIINGMSGGLAKRGLDFLGEVGGFISKVKKAFKGPFAIVGDPYSLWSMGVIDSVMHGMTMAFDQDNTVAASATDLVNRTKKTFEDSLSLITEDLGDTTEFNPVITPVLDLTKVAEDAEKIGGYISDSALAPTMSLNNARLISASPLTNGNSNPENSPGGTSGVTFQQIINAPTPISTADVYKHTRNQISMAKEELAIK